MTITIPTSAYPLTWPAFVPRTRGRHPAKFFRREKNVQGVLQNYDRTIKDGRDKIRDELGRMQVVQILISSDLQLRDDGLPYSSQESADPGVAVYWTRRVSGQLVPYCMPCDRWLRIADNLYAVGLAIEAMRGLERWGCVSVEQAFAGFAALPPGETPDAPASRPWREVLGESQHWPTGLDPEDTLALARSRFKKLMPAAHPDRGGSHEAAAALNAAMAEAERELATTP